MPCRVVKALVDCQRDCILDEEENGNTPLHLAASNGHYQAAKVLLDYKADGDARFVQELIQVW